MSARKFLHALVGGILVLSVLFTLILINFAPTSRLLIPLISISVVSLMGVAAFTLDSFRRFFNERREASQRLLDDVRMHRAETKLAARELREQLASAAYEAAELQQSLRQHVSTRATSGTERVRDSLYRNPPRTARELEQPTSTNRNLTSSTTQLDTGQLSSRLSAEISPEIDKLSEAATALASLLTEAQQTGISHTRDVSRTTAIKAKQIISVLEAQRQEFRRVRRDLQKARRQVSSTVQLTGREITQQIEKTVWNETNEHEALAQLYPRHELRDLMPPSGRWAMDARALLHLVQIVSSRKPKQILELGSGTSTIWLAYEAEKIGAKVLSVDHKEEFASLTRTYLGHHSLDSAAKVITSPLSRVRHDNTDYQWYDIEASDMPDEIDLLIVDGPPGSLGQCSRYPAVPQLLERLRSDAVIILDDSTREDERRILDKWLHLLPGYRQVDEGLSRLGILAPEDSSWLRSQKLQPPA